MSLWGRWRRALAPSPASQVSTRRAHLEGGPVPQAKPWRVVIKLGAGKRQIFPNAIQVGQHAFAAPKSLPRLEETRVPLLDMEDAPVECLPPPQADATRLAHCALD